MSCTVEQSSKSLSGGIPMRRVASHPPLAVLPPRVPAGATLVEVLMSLLIMSIGMVALMTLFPMAVLRSVEATKLTHGTNLRYNAEAMIDIVPGVVRRALLHDPDRDGNVSEHLINEDVDGNFVLDAVEDDGNANPPLDNNDGYLDRPVYVVDPLGWSELAVLGAGFEHYFGNDGAAALPFLRRFNYGITTPAHADGVVTLPDSWISYLPETPTAATATTVTLPPTVDLSSLPLPGPPESRVVLTDDSARTSQVRTITGIAPGPVISWTNPLPGGFTITKVRVQIQERRYTWLLTVRKSDFGNPMSLSASVDVVVFFNRSATQEDEIVYPALFGRGIDGQFGVAGFDDDNNGTDDDVSEFGWLGSDDLRTLAVTWSSLPDPLLKKGGYVFDAQNSYWYRIQDVTESQTSARAELTLDRDIVAFSNAGTSPAGGAILMRGVVDVFPLGTK